MNLLSGIDPLQPDPGIMRWFGSFAPSDATAVSRRMVAIIESSNDAIISKDLNGIITSWNEGATRVFGYSAEEVIGRSVTILIPPDHLDEEPAILARIRKGERVEHYQTVRRRKDGSLIHISLSVSPIKDDNGVVIGAAKFARDITAQKQAEALLADQALRLDRLNRVAKSLARDLDLDRIVQTVTDIATELTGAQFGAFFYNVINATGESYMLYTLSGAPRSAFEKFPMPRNTGVFDPTFKGTEVVRSGDIRQDPRYGKNAPYYGMPKGHLPVVSYLAVPVIGRAGEVLGGLFFGHGEADKFTQEAENIVVGIADHAAIAIDNARLHQAVQKELAQRRKAEETKELLLHEIQHRVKNTLATVLAVAAQSFKTAPREELKTFSARVHALAGAHALLTQSNWDRADVREVVDHAIEPFRARDRERFAIDGPAAALDAEKALTLALVLHELGTNAVKYGALSVETGRVIVAWNLIETDKGNCIRLTWREEGGPLVEPPKRRGFGSTLIEKALSGTQGKAQLRFEPAGLNCVLEIAL